MFRLGVDKMLVSKVELFTGHMDVIECIECFGTSPQKTLILVELRL